MTDKKRGERTLLLHLRNQPSSTLELRAAVDRIADACHLGGETRFELKLAATEALTNALREAPESHVVDVAISGCESAVDIEVTDPGVFAPRVRSDAERGLDRRLDAESGRGIPLMLALVDEVEFASTGRGTRVRMRKHIPPAGHGGAPAS
ncbi:MAG: ATP-binding protein [Gaiellaceae bacterium]